MNKIIALLFLVLSSVVWSKEKYDITRCHAETITLSSILSFIIPVSIPLLWLVTVVIILKSEFESPVDKLTWVIISFVPFLGPILFFTIGSKQRIDK